MIQINDVFPDINPAFCSLALSSFCKGYSEEAKDNANYSSLLIVIPVVISNDFDHFFYKKQRRSDFFQIVNQHPDILLTIKDRIKGTLQITQQALSFALSTNLLLFDSTDKFILNENFALKLKNKIITPRVRKYLNNAELLGVWMGRINSPETIFAYIGAIRA